MWPFKTRSNGGVTAAQVEIARQRATGTLKAGGYSGAESAIGLISRAFGAVTVQTRSGLISDALTPAFLSNVARVTATCGEALYAIRVRNGTLQLLPVNTFDVTGGLYPSSWMYQINLEGPSGSATQSVSAAEVLHFKYSQAKAEPWRGQGPLQLASVSDELARNITEALSAEASAPVGSVLPIPRTDGADSTVTALRGDLAGAKGDMLLVESMLESWGAGGRGTPEWGQRRFGANIPQPLIALHEAGFRQIVSAYGISPALFSDKAASAREAWRQVLFGVLLPLGRLFEMELELKLESEISFDWDALRASDLQGRARAFGALVKGGLDIKEAAAISGILNETD